MPEVIALMRERKEEPGIFQKLIESFPLTPHSQTSEIYNVDSSEKKNHSYFQGTFTVVAPMVTISNWHLDAFENSQMQFKTMKAEKGLMLSGRVQILLSMDEEECCVIINPQDLE